MKIKRYLKFKELMILKMQNTILVKHLLDQGLNLTEISSKTGIKMGAVFLAKKRILNF